MSIKVHNLADPGESYAIFDSKMSLEHCVVYCYADANNRMSEFLDATRRNDFSKFPTITRGKHSIACGDYATKINQE